MGFSGSLQNAAASEWAQLAYSAPVSLSNWASRWTPLIYDLSRRSQTHAEGILSTGVISIFFIEKIRQQTAMIIAEIPSPHARASQILLFRD